MSTDGTPISFYWFHIVGIPDYAAVLLYGQTADGNRCCVRVCNIRRRRYTLVTTVDATADERSVRTMNCAFHSELPRGAHKFVVHKHLYGECERAESVKEFDERLRIAMWFLLHRQIYGPCWLYIADAVWQGTEFVVQRPGNVIPESTLPANIAPARNTPQPIVAFVNFNSASSMCEAVTTDSMLPTWCTGNPLRLLQNVDMVVAFHVERLHKRIAPQNMPSGVICCEMRFVLRELIREPLDSYELEDVAEYLFPGDEALEHLDQRLVSAKMTQRIAEKLGILPITLALTKAAGNTWEGSLNGRRMERAEYYLCHAFHELDFILPPGKSGAAGTEVDVCLDSYKGATVLEPVLGFHDGPVALLDFKSLYPSMIREHNLCLLPERPVLPKLLERLLDARAQAVKRGDVFADAAFKLLANSLYGCLGSPHFRFHNRTLASDITSAGRRALQVAVDCAAELGYGIPLMGVCDAIAIRLAHDKHDCADLVNTINSRFRFVRIAVDKRISALYIVRKMGYAYLDAQTGDVLHVKGLLTHIWCRAARNIARDFLRRILCAKSSKNVPLPSSTESIVLLRAAPLHDMSISVTLGNDFNPFDMSLRASRSLLPHQRAALIAGLTLKAGDTIRYVVCTGYETGEFLTNTKRVRVLVPGFNDEIDYDWYALEQVERLLDLLASQQSACSDNQLVAAAVQQLVNDHHSTLIDQLVAIDESR